MLHFQALREDAASRRVFLKRMSAAGLGAAAIALFDASSAGAAENAESAAKAHPDSRTRRTINQFTALGIPGRDINEQIENYALTLEFLEADLYRQALNMATGKALTTPLSTNPNSYSLTVGGGSLSGNSVAEGFQLLLAFTYVEAAHRDFLRVAIARGGGTAVTANPTGYAFPGGPGATLSDILTNILALEETGVRAYLGALPMYTNFAAAQVAGTIYSTEARHSAAINYTLGNDPGPAKRGGDLMVIPAYPHNNTLEYFLEPTTVVSRAKTFFT